MNTYEWDGDAGDGAFGNPNNWFSIADGTPGVPGSADTAVVQATGTITGSGSVSVLDLVSSGGTLTTQGLSIAATDMVMTGTLALSSGSQFSVTDNVTQLGVSTVVQNNGVSMNIVGSDGTAGDLVTAMEFGESSSDKVAYTLTGLGTLMDASDGNIVVAGDGTATVTVTAGATLEADDASSNGGGNIYLAGAADAQATLDVTGAYTQLYLAGILDVGQSGTGHFTLGGGADAQIGQRYGSESFVVGDDTGSTGTAVITGAGTRLDGSLTGAAVIGGGGTGSMTVSAGATANLGSLIIGSGGTGTVIVEGAGSTLELHLQADVGSEGNGTLQVLSGAHFVLAGNNLSDTLTVGYANGVTGKLTVAGAGSSVVADNNQAQIGFYGTGSATISSGGAIATGAPSSSPTNTAAFVGIEAGSVGSVVIENANSKWTAHGEFDVGYYGQGTLLVESGGAVSSGNYNGVAGFVEGSQAGSSGTVTVTGTGSKITNNGRFIVGDAGAGMLTISAGATVTTALPSGSNVDGAVIGDLSGETGHVTVGGTGSKWTIGSDLIIGDAGAGGLQINAGGTVSAASLLMASTGTGSLTLSGTGAKLAVSGNALFGSLGKASVSIGAGGTLSVGGAGEIKDGSIALTGGSLSDSKTLTVDAGQALKGYGTVTTAGLINSSTVQANGGTLSFIGGITGTGKFDIAAGSTLSLGSAVSSGQQVIFQSATSKLVLGAPTAFAGMIASFVKGDTIDLSNVVASSLTYAGQTLTVHESGGASFALKFTGSYTQTSFGAPKSDGHGGTLITHT